MKHKTLINDIILGVVALIVGIGIIWLAHFQKLPFFRNSSPGAGFFPVICGIAVCICGALLIILYIVKKPGNQSSDAEIKKEEIRSFLMIIIGAWLVVLLSEKLGLLPCVAVVVFFLVRFLGKESWKTAAFISIGTLVFLYLIFDLFLKVPLPWGIFGK